MFELVSVEFVTVPPAAAEPVEFNATVWVVVLVAETEAALVWLFSTANCETTWLADVTSLVVAELRLAGIEYWAEAVAFRALVVELPVASDVDWLPVIDTLEAEAFGSE